MFESFTRRSGDKSVEEMKKATAVFLTFLMV
jgi:hypothetical protein